MRLRDEKNERGNSLRANLKRIFWHKYLGPTTKPSLVRNKIEPGCNPITSSHAPNRLDRLNGLLFQIVLRYDNPPIRHRRIDKVLCCI